MQQSKPAPRAAGCFRDRCSCRCQPRCHRTTAPADQDHLPQRTRSRASLQARRSPRQQVSTFGVARPARMSVRRRPETAVRRRTTATARVTPSSANRATPRHGLGERASEVVEKGRSRSCRRSWCVGRRVDAATGKPPLFGPPLRDNRPYCGTRPGVHATYGRRRDWARARAGCGGRVPRRGRSALVRPAARRRGGDRQDDDLVDGRGGGLGSRARSARRAAVRGGDGARLRRAHRSARRDPR